MGSPVGESRRRWRRRMVGCAVGLAAVLVLAGCGSMWDWAQGESTAGERRSMDGSRARSELADRGITVPDDFEFAEGYRWLNAFVGSARLAARFDGPDMDGGDVLGPEKDDRGRSIFHDIDCGSKLLVRDDLELLGFECGGAGRVQIARTSPLVGQSDEELAFQLGEAVMILVSGISGTALFAIDVGT